MWILPYYKVTFTLHLCLLFGCEISRCSGLLKHTHSLPCLRKIIFIFHGVLHLIISYLCDDPFSFLIRMSSEFPFCSCRWENINQEISLWAWKQLKCNSCRGAIKSRESGISCLVLTFSKENSHSQCKTCLISLITQS
jgi:hypothetical protein